MSSTVTGADGDQCAGMEAPSAICGGSRKIHSICQGDFGVKQIICLFDYNDIKRIERALYNDL